MKKHTSVLMLLARSSIYKITLVLAAMALIRALTFQTWISSSLTAGILYLAELSLITWILCRSGRDQTGSHQNYTLQRLGITENAIFFWQSTYNFLVYLILWGFQLITAYLLCRYHLESGSQNLFLAFARSDYLHTLMPASEILAWIKNIIYMTAMALGSAWLPLSRRRGLKDGNQIILLTVFTLTWYVNGTGEVMNNITAILIALITSAANLLRLLRKDVRTSDA